MSDGDYRGTESVPVPGYWAPDEGDVTDVRQEARYCRCCWLQLTVLETDVCTDCRAEIAAPSWATVTARRSAAQVGGVCDRLTEGERKT